MAWCPAAGGFCVAIGVAAAELTALRQDLQQAQSLAIVVNKPSQGGGGGYAKALALSNLIGSENECLYRLRSSQLRACGSSASDYSQAKIKEGNVFLKRMRRVWMYLAVGHVELMLAIACLYLD